MSSTPPSSLRPDPRPLPLARAGARPRRPGPPRSRPPRDGRPEDARHRGLDRGRRSRRDAVRQGSGAISRFKLAPHGIRDGRQPGVPRLPPGAFWGRRGKKPRVRAPSSAGTQSDGPSPSLSFDRSPISIPQPLDAPPPQVPYAPPASLRPAHRQDLHHVSPPSRADWPIRSLRSPPVCSCPNRPQAPPLAITRRPAWPPARVSSGRCALRQV